MSHLSSKTETTDVRERLYKSYSLTAVAITLTLGIIWGALLLSRIGRAANFTAVSVFETNAHGHAQIYGWASLFLLALCWKLLPLRRAGDGGALAAGTLALVIFTSGVILVAFATWRGAGLSIAPLLLFAGFAAQCAAILVLARQFAQLNSLACPAGNYIGVGLLFLFLHTVASLWHSLRLVGAQTREDLLWQIATFQAPLRDLQVHGASLFLVFGLYLVVEARYRPASQYDGPTRQVSLRRRGIAAFRLLLIGVVSEIAFFLAYRFSENHALAGLLLFSWLNLLAGVLLYVFNGRGKPALPIDARSWIDASFFWLLFSLLMLLVMPLYLYAAGMAFSHAYYGAVRHAATVGFLSVFLIGASIAVTPLASRFLSFSFVLVNSGCFLRVALQTLSDKHPPVFALLPLSAVLEFAGFSLWAIVLAAAFYRGISVCGKPDGITAAVPETAFGGPELSRRVLLR